MHPANILYQEEKPLYIDSNMLINIAELLGSFGVVWGIVVMIVRFFDRQKKQDADIKDIKEEQTMTTYVLLAVLDGLKQQGCNGEVTKAHDKLSKFINEKAHGTKEE